MCGIVGYITLKSFCTSPLDAMMHAVAHRGSNGQGVYRHNGVAFGHHRLAIFDPHPRSQQPFQTAHAAWMVNGAFYNYTTLKQQYASYPWMSCSDNEVLNPLLQDKGPQGPQHLQGMYALAWHDQSQNQVILARDRWGIKPLYYVRTSDAFYFASQISALRHVVPSAHISAPQRHRLLQHRWLDDDTLHPEIHRFPAGETWTIHTQTLHIDCHRPREFPSQLQGHAAPSDPQYFHDNLTQTLDRHTQGDVPMGIFLSGGIDSQTLAWHAPHLPCFYATFEHTPPEIVQRHAHPGPLHRVHVTPELFWHTLPQVLKVMDDPFLDPALVPSFLLARRAQAEGVKVILSGEGADEFLGGYRRYRRPYWRRWGQTMHRTGLTFWPTLAHIHAQDQRHWLPGLLTKLDRLLMAWNIEGRTPFVDTHFSAYCHALPDGQKVRGRQGKWILRHHGAQYFSSPNAWVWQKKQGFTYPVEAWVTQNPKLLPWLIHHPSIQGVDIPTFQKKGWLWRLTFYALWHEVHQTSPSSLPSLLP